MISTGLDDDIPEGGCVEGHLVHGEVVHEKSVTVHLKNKNCIRVRISGKHKQYDNYWNECFSLFVHGNNFS